MPWWLAALGGSALTALAGWVVVVGVVVGSWLSAIAGSLGGAFSVGTKVWLLVHGAAVTYGDVRITLVPLGASLVLSIVLGTTASYAAHQASLSRTPKVAAFEAGRITLTVGAVCAAVYTVLVAAVAMLLLGSGQASRVGLATGIVAFVASCVGARAGAGWSPTRAWPRWARAIPCAILAALAVLLASGALLVVIVFAQHSSQMAHLQEQLGGGVVGALVLGIVQASYAPNYVLWAVSWLLGPGFHLGPDSLVSMADTHLGLLPGLPVFGAVPSPGPGRGYLGWWLATGVLAGAAAGWVVVRSRRRARFDETALTGGLSGILAGFVVVGVCALSCGDLGSVRLQGVGPRLELLAILAPSILGLSGLGAGLLIGLLRPPLPPGEDPEEYEQTVSLRRR